MLSKPVDYLARIIVIILITAATLCNASEAESPRPLNPCVVYTVELHSALFFPADKLGFSPTQRLYSVVLDTGSCITLTHILADSNSNAWCFGTATPTIQKRGYTLFEPEIDGWINMTAEKEFYSETLKSTERLKGYLDDIRAEAAEQERIRFEKWKKENTNLGVTYLAYLKIRNGMSRFDVTTLLGSDDYTETSAIESQRTLVWGNSEKNISVVIDGLSVIGKMQKGLNSETQ